MTDPVRSAAPDSGREDTLGRTFDVAVIGLGAVGSATLAALAARGLSVVGLDRWTPPHPHGSSHGESRMIREAYFEAAFYVPLVQRAYEEWRDLEIRSGAALLHETGGLMIGSPEGALVRGTLESARAHDLPHEVLDPVEVAGRHPAFRLPDGTVAVFEPRAGFLDPEACVAAFLARAVAQGATVRTDEAVEGWAPRNGLLVVRTPRGEIRARRALLAAGAWNPGLLGEARVPLRVVRVVQHWFRPRAAPESLEPARCPVWAWEYEPERVWYGFPARPRGVKVGLHHGDPIRSAEAVRRDVSEGETQEIRDRLARHLPDAAGASSGAEVCLYTETPDGHFVIDRLPGAPGVVLASACSGHGFKFASALGPLLADLLTDRDPEFDLYPFRVARF